MQMKKFFIFLVLMTLCATAADAQRYFIPKFQKKKEIRTYELDKSERRWTLTVGGSYDMALGMQEYIHYADYKESYTSGKRPNFSGGGGVVGLGLKLGGHVVAGVEAGYLYVNQQNTIPVTGAFKFYYGPGRRVNRHRWFNYLNIGPQFYVDSNYKSVGATGSAGVGMRVLFARTMKVDLQLGYRCTMRRPEFELKGNHDLNINRVSYNQFIHGISFGMNFIIF